MTKAFSSSLAPYMDAFLRVKHSLGWKYESGEFYLREFDRHFARNESEPASFREIVKCWANLRATECSNTQHVRLAPIREFGKFLQSSGYSDSYIIPKKASRKQTRTIPHFFTKDEIAAFFRVCDDLPQRKENIARHLALTMLYRLLYSCGVRTCEARLLMRKNTNLRTGYIDIFHSKKLKDRRVFIREDLRLLYLKYDEMINAIFPDRTYFFPVRPSTCYKSGTISQNFNKIWKAAGLGHQSGPRARAYDFRHHFAFSNLNKWIEEEIDVNSMLPYLMRQMGHSCLESTYYYLHLVPEIFGTISKRINSLESLLPEVGLDEEN